MGKSKKATCPHCGKTIEDNDVQRKYKNRTYHMHCYKEVIQQTYHKTDSLVNDKNELYNYIKKLYQTPELDPKILAQIDKYYKDYELSYQRILLTLMYYFEIKEHKVIHKYGIGIVPSEYKNAESFWKTVATAREKNKDKDVRSTVSPKIYKVPKYTEKPPKLIDINKL